MFVDRAAGGKPGRVNIRSIRRTRVLIFGGGFGGLYAALEFENGVIPISKSR
jgi:hypothetical protein